MELFTKRMKKREKCKVKYFWRLIPFNTPWILIPFGIVFSAIGGCIFPVFGIFWAKIMFVMQPDYITKLPPSLDKIDEYAGIMIGLAVLGGSIIFINRSIFGILGASLMKTMRFRLYSAILRKEVGWFDSKDNAPSYLTSAIATDV